MSDPHVIIAGASGVIGRRLIEALRGAPAPPRITVLTRGADGALPAGVTSTVWRPAAGREGDDAALNALAATLEGASGLVNLAGSSIAAGRLDAAHVARVKGSRIDATTTLLAAARRCAAPPAAWVQGSAVGIYGDRGDELLTEEAAPGDASFPLVPVGIAWEAAAAPAAEFTRLTVARVGVVFDRDAETWRKLLLPVQLFAGGPLGSGRQWLPWISGHDVARALRWLLETPTARGTYHLTAPEPARQIDVTRTAGRALRRPVWLPAPAFALRLALGGVADALLLASQRVVPARLQAEGFAFRDPSIEGAIGGLT